MRDERVRPGSRFRGDGPRRTAAAALLSALLAGCHNGNLGPSLPPPRDAREALQRVNQNLARLRHALVCRGCTVTFRFRDADGRSHAFLAQPASMIFLPPRDLRLAVSGLTGNVAMVGSNQERFWLWIEPEVSTMWWGSWHDAATDAPRPPRGELPLPPAELLSALALQPLPEEPEIGLPPMLDTGGRRPRLLYVRVGDDGWPYAAREVALDDRPPYQPVEIVQRDALGRVAMRATLAGYARVGDDGPCTPRRYVVSWPLDDAELRFDVGTAMLRPDQPPFATFPADPPVKRIECLDDDQSRGGEASVNPS